MELWVVAESVVEVSQLPTSENSSPYFSPFKTQSRLFCTASSHRQACLFVLFRFLKLAYFLNPHAGSAKSLSWVVQEPVRYTSEPGSFPGSCHLDRIVQ